MAETRLQIQTNARVRADQDSSDFPSIAQYNMWIDQGGKAVWYELLKAGWPANYASVLITPTGATQYPLGVSTPILGIHGVYFIQGSDFYPLHRINEGKRASLRSSTYLPSGFSGFYDMFVDVVNGPTLELLPKPLGGGQYQVDYIPGFAGFANDSALWVGPDRSDELIELWAAIRGVKKEGAARAEDAAMLKAEYDELLESVRVMASAFDLRNPAQIRDVNSERGRYSFDYPLAGPDPVGY